MCVGPEVLATMQAIGAGVGALAGIKTLMGGSKASAAAAPEVVRTDQVADDTAARTQAAQEAQAATLATRQKLRSNSLLSQAGAAGDSSMADTTKTGAKAVLGA